jgi:hypothetical protein
MLERDICIRGFLGRLSLLDSRPLLTGNLDEIRPTRTLTKNRVIFRCTVSVRTIGRVAASDRLVDSRCQVILSVVAGQSS